MRFKVGKQQPKGFRASARYLAGRTKRHDRHDVLWAEERELGTTDPDRAAALMELTAQKSARVKQAALHFIIAFDPKDAGKGKLHPDVMREIAADVVGRLGLGGHQMLIYAHRDKSHPHIHFLVNRVHPETGKAWSHRNIGIRLKEACREIAMERGLNVLKDRTKEREHENTKDRKHDRNDEKGLDKWSAVEEIAGPPTDADYRLAKKLDRDPERPFNARTLAMLRSDLGSVFRSARSWQDLSERLAMRGLLLRPKGQGLILTDGEAYAKLSQLGKTVRMKELEARFGERFADFHAREAAALVKGMERERSAFSDLPPGLSDEARIRAKQRQGQGRETGEDAIIALDHADSDYRVWVSLEQSLRAGEYCIARAKRELHRQEWWAQRWEGGSAFRRETFMSALRGMVADAERANEYWRELEREHGVAEAARMVLATPGLLKTPYLSAGRKASPEARRAVEKSWKELVRNRQRWRDAQARLADARHRVEVARSALARARYDYRHLMNGIGSPDMIRRHVLEKVRIRARALDRVSARMFEETRLADERVAQLHRAWRRHNDRKRERQRERMR